MPFSSPSPATRAQTGPFPPCAVSLSVPFSRRAIQDIAPANGRRQLVQPLLPLGLQVGVDAQRLGRPDGRIQRKPGVVHDLIPVAQVHGTPRKAVLAGNRRERMVEPVMQFRRQVLVRGLQEKVKIEERRAPRLLTVVGMAAERCGRIAPLDALARPVRRTLKPSGNRRSG